MMMGMGTMGGGMSPGYGYGISGAGALFWIGLLAVIVGIVYYLLKDTRGVQGAGAKDALAVLKERYVKGEIQRDDYLAMKEDLEG